MRTLKECLNKFKKENMFSRSVAMSMETWEYIYQRAKTENKSTNHVVREIVENEQRRHRKACD